MTCLWYLVFFADNLLVDFTFCRMTHLNSGVLQIYPVHTSDSGVYRCRGSNTAGTRLGSEIPVVVTQGKVQILTFKYECV